MNSILKSIYKMKERELNHLSEAIDLELQRRFAESREAALPADEQGGDADVLSMMPGAQSDFGSRRVA